MCFRRIKLLMRIDEATEREILSYMGRIFRVYCILFIVDLIVLFLPLYNHNHISGWDLATVVLYIIALVSLRMLTKHPKPLHCLLPMGSSLLLALFNTIQAAYTIAETASFISIFNIISVLIQASTIYILYKLREKMLVRISNEANNNTSEPSAPADGESAELGYAYNPSYAAETPVAEAVNKV